MKKLLLILLFPFYVIGYILGYIGCFFAEGVDKACNFYFKDK